MGNRYNHQRDGAPCSGSGRAGCSWLAPGWQPDPEGGPATASSGDDIQAYVDADRFAQVWYGEADRYGETPKALLSPRVRTGMDMQPQDCLLNEVTS